MDIDCIGFPVALGEERARAAGRETPLKVDGGSHTRPYSGPFIRQCTQIWVFTYLKELPSQNSSCDALNETII